METKTKNKMHALNAEQIENVKTWIKFLRENPGRQIKGRLVDARGGCCALGAALLAHYPAAREAYAEATTLPLEMKAVLGLRSLLGRAKNDLCDLLGLSSDYINSITTLNDVRGFSFLKIADIIERDLETNCYGFFVQPEEIITEVRA